MELSPELYHKIVRPSWSVKLYMHKLLNNYIEIRDKKILDFGCGIGSCSSLFSPKDYLGVDTDKERVSYAKRLYKKHNFQAIEEYSLPADKGSMDYILIVAVLHHIASHDIKNYVQEFSRVLKPEGKIIIIEPCFFKNSFINNWFMNYFDKGNYIRKEDDYFKFFTESNFKIKLLKKYKQLFFYNKIFFLAEKQYLI